MNYSLRISNLRAHMAAEHLEALLLTHEPDVHYLCGFTGSNAALLILPRRAVLVTDGRYTTQAGEQCAGTGVRVRTGKHPLPQACGLLLRAGVASAAFDSGTTQVAALHRMQAALPESMSKALQLSFFKPLPNSPVATLRQVKDEDELRLMEEAALVGCKIFDTALTHMAAGVPERDIAAELEYAARKLGADAMSFETIVASGKRSSMPHGHASGQGLPRRGFVTLDFGVMLRGYCSDMTRTVYLGKPTREEKEVYAAVLAAEQAGIAAVRAGVIAGKIDRATRGTLRGHGLAKFFTHSTGHGVGLEIHESPRIGAKAQDVLAAGMVITVEPGVYLPDRFGVRIEDMVVVEEKSARVLTPTPRELLTL